MHSNTLKERKIKLKIIIIVNKLFFSKYGIFPYLNDLVSVTCIYNDKLKI